MLKVLHSVSDPISLLKVIQRHYPSIGANHCELMELGCNDNYHIKGRRQDYVFRLNRHNWWPENSLAEELRLLETMHRNQLNVCKPVRAANKQRYIKTRAPEGIRFGALFHFIPGRHLGLNFGRQNSNMLKLGEMVARMHTIADNMKQPVQRWTIGFENIVTHFLDEAPVVLAHREKDLAYLHQIAKQLEDVIFDQPEGAYNVGLCHGDLHTHNVMLQPDGDLAIFDFDWCGYSWRVYDLATIWWSLATRKVKNTPWQAFLRGYTQHRPLTRQEKKNLPWFFVFRYFEYLNFQLSMRKYIGANWLNDNYYDHHIGFIKQWIKQMPVK